MAEIDVSSAGTAMHHIASIVGYPSIDEEIMLWVESDPNLCEEIFEFIKDKHPYWFDEPEVDPCAKIGNGFLQSLHSALHPNGPYGWEFCGKCKI